MWARSPLARLEFGGPISASLLSRDDNSRAANDKCLITLKSAASRSLEQSNPLLLHFQLKRGRHSGANCQAESSCGPPRALLCARLSSATIGFRQLATRCSLLTAQCGFFKDLKRYWWPPGSSARGLSVRAHSDQTTILGRCSPVCIVFMGNFGAAACTSASAWD